MTNYRSGDAIAALLQVGGTALILIAAYAIYLGFLSPMNRGRGMEGGAALMATVFGALGAFLIYQANRRRARAGADEGRGPTPKSGPRLISHEPFPSVQVDKPGYSAEQQEDPPVNRSPYDDAAGSE